MTPMPPIDVAEESLLHEAQELLAVVGRHATVNVITVADAIDRLALLRAEVYESLNQLQHEYLIVRAAVWLRERKVVPDNCEWFWNPRQTGDHSEPDLAGRCNGECLVSAEITASARPTGILDTRMAKTLKKLNAMEGAKYYFVRSDTMSRRAQTKVAKNQWPIQVVMLGMAGAL
jgi:hypothetical protein